MSKFLQKVNVSAPSELEFTLPLSWLYGVSEDSNGIPVEGVGFDTFSDFSTKNRAILYLVSTIKSDSQGGYTMALYDGYKYTIRVEPPIGSGFATSIVREVMVAGNTPLDVIFQKPDFTAPKFISGPLATNISQNQATLVWETDEPARGSVTMAGNSVTETSYRTQHGVLLTGLTESTTYTATVTATDRSGNGPTTATATFATTASPDTAPPIITAGPSLAFYDPYTTVINWETNEPATTRVTGDATYEDGGFVKIHAAELHDLAASKEHKVTISSTDAAGNGPVTRDISFTTPPATDTLAPVITKGPWSIDITSSAATIAWETNEPANSGVSYNDGTAYEVLNDDALTFSHAVRMTGLKPNTAYNVTVSSKDAMGNGPTLSETFVVRTLVEQDNQAPVFLSPPTACNVNRQLIQLCFVTDEPSSVVVRYGTTSDKLEKAQANAPLIQQHTLPINGLTPSTNYFFRISVKDQAGNESVSEVLQVATLAGIGQDPVFVTEPTVSYEGQHRAVIEWETDRPCTALVEYGIKNYASQVSSAELSIKHSLVLPRLNPATTYQYRVTATDVDGKKAVVAGPKSLVSQFNRLVKATSISGELTTAVVADKTPPAISKAPEVEVVDDVINIRWSTNEAADSRIYYGKKSETVRRVAGGIDFATSHQVRLPAVTPVSDYSFRIISVDPAGNVYTSPDYDFSASSPATFTLTVVGGDNGTITSTPSGINCGSDCSENYAKDTGVTLTATPKAGYQFTGWSGACSGTASCVVTMGSNQTVNASFTAQPPNTNQLNVSMTGNGSITSTPMGINCGSTCSASFNSGTSVTLSAVADANYTFTGWSGDCSGMETCSLTMSANKTVSANFAATSAPPNAFSLSVSKSGNGTVTSKPTTIRCGTNCSSTFTAGSRVTLSAEPDNGFAFANWDGACSGTATCTVVMDGDKSVSAKFVEAPKHPIKVTKPNLGVITSEPAGIQCGGANKQCAASFSSAKLTATPNSGFEFVKWNGCQAPEGHMCLLKPTGKVTASAVFRKLPKYKLMITKNTIGSVFSTPAGLKCPDRKSKCEVRFIKGAQVTLTPLPQAGRSFVGWTGACSGNDSCTILMDGKKGVGAMFQ
jgi:uncharacterized repeat protein (TIGR02543 family)